MKKMILILMAVMVLLSGCFSFGKKPYYIYNDDGQVADKRLEEILEALKAQDKERIKSMFSKTALTEATAFDAHMDYLLDFFQGDIQSWERKGCSASASYHYGKAEKTVNAWYQVNTDVQSYLFIFVESVKDTENPDNIGLYSLRVIQAEAEKSWSWQDMEVPGIYMADTKGNSEQFVCG